MVRLVNDADAQARLQARREEAEVKRWHERWKLADNIYKKWAKRFQCADNWDWYEGYQGKNAHSTGDPSQDPYIVNLIFPTVEVKIPTLYFHNPKATVVPRAAREDDVMTSIQERVRLREDTVNTFMTDPGLHLKDHTNQALKEAFFYFGVIEVGFSGSYVNNPNAGKPMLEDESDPETAIVDPETQMPIMEPPIIPEDEQVFIKQIPAEQFRMSARSGFLLKDSDWCGYYEYVYASDLRADPGIANRDKIKATAKWDTDYTGKIDLNEPGAPDGYLSPEEMPAKQGMVKVLNIWDIRTQSYLKIPEEGNYYLTRPEPYDPFPFATLKFHERKQGWLPLPPVFNWKSPQAEYNDTRQKEKAHRARADRKYQHQKGMISADEKSKLEKGGDMTIIETVGPIPAIAPIEDAPLDAAVSRNVMVTKVDFMEITASGSDQRQVAESETATQAQVIETRARIRESFGQAQIAAWVSDIARIMLETIEKHVSLPYWIIRNIDPLSPAAPLEALEVADVYQQITADQLGDLNYDVVVAAESLSPINEDLERARFTEVMGLVFNSLPLMLAFRTSDALLRKFLSLHGMRNEKLVQQFKLAIDVNLLAMAPMTAALPQDQGESGENAIKGALATAGAQGGGGKSGPPSATPGALLPGLPAIVQQITKQIGTGGAGVPSGS